MWLYPLKLKSDIFETFINFHQRVERQFNLKIQNFQSDWGGESQPVNKYLKDLGIHHRLSCPHTPAQNGTAERKHKHIIETALSLMKQASMPHKFWDEVACTTVYLINRMSTPLLNYKSPYSLLFTQEPNYNFLCNFGCACYPYLRHYAASKLDSRSKWCAFIGYSAFHNGYRCISMSSGRIYISRDVIFTENYYPFADKLNDNPSSMESIQSVRGILGSFPIEVSIKPPTPETLYSNPLHTSPDNISTLPTSDNESSPVLLPPHHYESLISIPPAGHIPQLILYLLPT